MRYLLDTHTWVWWNADPGKLSPRTRRLLSGGAPNAELLLSCASVWEFCRWLREGRIGLSCAAEEWIEAALGAPDLRLVPLTPRIAYQATVLPGPFHGDEIDAILAATARVENATILTKDACLASYRHAQSFW
jgi:PIN domain nuclease of toxin-antitoxin system